MSLPAYGSDVFQASGSMALQQEIEFGMTLGAASSGDVFRHASVLGLQRSVQLRKASIHSEDHAAAEKPLSVLVPVVMRTVALIAAAISASIALARTAMDAVS